MLDSNLPDLFVCDDGANAGTGAWFLRLIDDAGGSDDIIASFDTGEFTGFGSSDSPACAIAPGLSGYLREP